QTMPADAARTVRTVYPHHQPGRVVSQETWTVSSGFAFLTPVRACYHPRAPDNRNALARSRSEKPRRGVGERTPPVSRRFIPDRTRIRILLSENGSRFQVPGSRFRAKAVPAALRVLEGPAFNLEPGTWNLELLLCPASSSAPPRCGRWNTPTAPS